MVQRASSRLAILKDADLLDSHLSQLVQHSLTDWRGFKIPGSQKVALHTYWGLASVSFNI